MNGERGRERTKKTIVKRRPAAMSTEKRKSHPERAQEGDLDARGARRRAGKVEKRVRVEYSRRTNAVEKGGWVYCRHQKENGDRR